MDKPLEIVLLLALPASGKSEVRRYLANIPADSLARDFHIGETLQLDDFPYVHMMRRADEELSKLGGERVFFRSGDKPFIDPRDWGTLIQLINEDYRDLTSGNKAAPVSAAELLLSRMDEAGGLAGIKPRLSALDPGTRKKVASALEKEARAMLEEKHAAYPASLEGKTIVIEAARGGPAGSSMPLQAPFGYGYSIGQLDPEILKRASILYVWVTPEESRRKNDARTDPNDPGSILHHGVPIDVMMNDYGCDDMDWLEKNSSVPGTVAVGSGGKTFNIPVARFDNRVDKTSFLREDREKWAEDKVRAVREGIKAATDKLYAFRAAVGS